MHYDVGPCVSCTIVSVLLSPSSLLCVCGRCACMCVCVSVCVFVCVCVCSLWHSYFPFTNVSSSAWLLSIIFPWGRWSKNAHSSQDTYFLSQLSLFFCSISFHFLWWKRLEEEKKKRKTTPPPPPANKELFPFTTVFLLHFFCVALLSTISNNDKGKQLATLRRLTYTALGGGGGKGVGGMICVITEGF